MDWEFKPSSSWDLTELDIDDFDVVGKNQNMEVFSLDSGSGVLGEDGIMNKLSGQKHSTRSSFSVVSSKKPRLQGSDQLVSCLVDGCTADLTGCRDYHRRHRVCETHSKTPVVTIRGKEQRFCQQCSRFHSLGEFDEVKRSCRKRLDGHNRRRRKPRAESMYLNYGSFLTNHQGTKLLRFGGSPAYTTTFDGWPENEKPNQKLHVTVEKSTPSNSYACFCSARERKFPFLLGDDEKLNQPLYEASFQQFVNTNAASSSLSSAAELVVEPKSALSLLSKHTIHHHASALGSGPTNLFQFNFNGSMNQHSGQHLPFRNVTGPDTDQLIGMIHFRTEGLLENEAAQVLSFSWEQSPPGNRELVN